jgi:hypothetical protein
MKSPMMTALLFLTANASGVQAAAPATTTAPAKCTSAESHQFDFWVGSWEVWLIADKPTKVADTVVEKTFMDCAVIERRKPTAGGGGESLNAYVPEKHSWRQVWLGAVGGFLDSTGTWNGESMVVTGQLAQPGGKSLLARQSYTPQPDGTIKQVGEMSSDNGSTWQTSFIFSYRRPADE